MAELEADTNGVSSMQTSYTDESSYPIWTDQCRCRDVDTRLGMQPRRVPFSHRDVGLRSGCEKVQDVLLLLMLLSLVWLLLLLWLFVRLSHLSHPQARLSDEADLD